MRTYTDLMVAEEYDQLISEIPPTTRYVVVGSPRSGTNLLCDLLYQSGMGVPMEYFTEPASEELSQRWGVFPPDYTSMLMQRRTTGDVFGVKITQPHEWDLVRATWPTHIIKMIREDKKAQAESFARAAKTHYWADVGDIDDRPVSVLISPEELTSAENTLLQYEQFWNQIPASIELSYEYLVNDKTATLRAVIESFGLQLPDDWECPAPRVKKLHYGGAVDLGTLA